MADAGLSGEECESPPVKKVKVQSEDETEDEKSIHDTEICMSTFEMTRVLQNNCTRKQIWVQGTFKGREKPAIVLLEKKTFPDDELFLNRGFFNDGSILRKVYRNDIYGNYECFPTREYNGLNVTVIYPATPNHIEKFQKKDLHIVEETPELYQKVTIPYIESKSFSLDWIYNILDHKAEEENIVYEDRDKESGFVMVSDLKWDGQPGTLKMIALPFKKIRSIRELNASHLPLLKNIQIAGTEAINEKFNVPASQLRIYLHYQPTYYYLHVHFAYLMFDTPGIYVEKAHLLSTVIKNIELMPDYYEKATLSYVVVENDPLFTKFQEHGVLGKSKTETNQV